MNPKQLAHSYQELTPDERYRLLLAAGARDDEVECERLHRSASELDLAIPDHAPYGYALHESSLRTFIKLQDEAAFYFEALARADTFFDEDEAEESLGERYDANAKAGGYLLRARVAGWKCFCAKRNIPPLLLWECLPGYERVQRTLGLVEDLAFSAEEMLAWMNRVRAQNEPELTEVPQRVDTVADSLEKAFQEMAAWWGG